MDNIAISVICNTYNHGKYIRQTLDGFLMQKTNFAIEVLVHDDASTDDTPTIIREYTEQHPDLFKPILQTENQHSKGIKISATYQFPRARGRYIAYCEGDDYWTDPEKLQKQYDALEAHPELDMCAHATMRCYPDGHQVAVSYCSETRIVPTEEMIRKGGLSFNSCSLVFRKSMLDVKWRFFEFMRYDYTMKIVGSLRGGILCLPDNMATYRFMSGPDAWTTRVLKDHKREIEHTKKRLQMLDYLNEDTDYRFADAIADKKRKLEYDCLWYEDDFKAMCSPEYADLFQRFSKKKRMLVKTGRVFPRLVKQFHHKVLDRYLKGSFR